MQKSQQIILIGSNIEIVTSAQGSPYEIVGATEIDSTLDAGVPIIGDDQFVLSQPSKFDQYGFVVAVDDCVIREKLYKLYTSAGFRMATLILGTVSHNSSVGDGVLIMPGVTISDRSKIAENCCFNFGAFVGHDNQIAQSTIFAPRAMSLGHVVVGERTYVGAASTICPRLEVGADCLISAGSTIIKNLKSGIQVMGYYPVPKMHLKFPNSKAPRH
jgi:sugar O-acyltransferase (sialic acid O-acetyltransferase NeuD family)